MSLRKEKITPTSSDDFCRKLHFGSVKPYGNNCKLIPLTFTKGTDQVGILLQMPKMRMPFGLSKFANEKGTAYSVQFDLEQGTSFYELLKAVDFKALQHVHANQREYLNESGQSLEYIRAKGCPLVKTNAKYPDRYNVQPKFALSGGSPSGMIVDSKRLGISFDDISPGEGVAIVELTGIWAAAGRFGVKLTLLQLQCFPIASPTSELLIDDFE